MRLLGLVAVLAVVAAPLAMADPIRGTTSGGSLDVLITPGSASFVMEFLKPSTDRLQEHVDYTVEVTNGDTQIFGPILLTHTTPGKVTIPAVLQDGTNEITVTVRGILFVPIDDETLTVQAVVGQEAVPPWVRTNAGWWAAGQIDDATFLTGVQYLIENGIIAVQAAGSSGGDSDGAIPGWIKNTAGWWADGQIPDSGFLNALTYLIENGIISVTIPTSAGPLVIGGVDLSQASPRLGSADASVTIIEFGDYQCPRCKTWFENTKPSLDTNYINAGIANLYFVDVKYIKGDSIAASIATYCAQDQGMYWEYHDTLYENQGAVGGWASAENLVGFADDAGLDAAEFETCLQSGEKTERLDFNAAQGDAQGVTGTPHFIIVGPGGSEHIRGPQPYHVFDTEIQELLN